MGLTDDGAEVRFNIEDIIRNTATEARRVTQREQAKDVVTLIINDLTVEAMKASREAGEAQGYNRKLKEELARQLDVQEQLVAKVAWYEQKTRATIGGRVDGFGEHLIATGIRCMRCNRQIEDRGNAILEHFAMHEDEDREDARRKREADQARYDADRAEMAKPKAKKAKPRGRLVGGAV